MSLASPPREQRILDTRDLQLSLRPVRTSDGPLLAEFYRALSEDDLRFRFLDSRKQPGRDEIARMLDVDHERSEHLLAFETTSGALVASLMLAREDSSAEVSIAVARDWCRRGIGWTLLKHAAELARAMGARRLYSLELRGNQPALEVEHDLGFHAKPLEGAPELLLVEADLA